ncbi:MAG: DUF1080 domain-containing protein [Phycisphaerales bacterium]|nr:DUF1080 domain-containing protein [Phycisphaerales bacterium]
MKQIACIAALCACLVSPAFAQQTVHEHQSPPGVEAAKARAAAPPEAIVLFDGSSLGAWQTAEGKSAPWTLHERDMVIKPGTGSIQTRQAFGPMHLHIEFCIPPSPEEVSGQARGNSGVYLAGLYEIQILDAFDAAPASNLAGGIYGIQAPLVNAARRAGEWQTYDIDFAPPRFDHRGNKTAEAMTTVIFNGVVIHERVAIPGPTGGGLSSTEAATGPIMLQDHGDAIRFRNIWVVEKAHALSKDTPPLFRPIFNGQTLDGWVQRGGRADYRVEDGAIVGETRPNQPNTFLCTEREYADFELDLEFKIDDALNSGVQIRSHSRPDYRDGAVHGYQVEIDPSNRAYTCGIYEEQGRGWLDNLDDNVAARTAYRNGQWNRMRVVAHGHHIRTWINGVPAADLIDDNAASGFIGLQVHGVGDRADPLQVRWRHIMLRELNTP